MNIQLTSYRMNLIKKSLTCLERALKIQSQLHDMQIPLTADGSITLSAAEMNQSLTELNLCAVYS